MRPLAHNEITGTWATVLLPIADDESIDFSRLVDELDALVAARVDGIYTNGTAGEFYAQSESEFDRVSMLVAERCETAGIPFQLGASHPNAQATLERVKRAAELQPGAIQVILPDWYPLTDDEIFRFLEGVAAAASPVGIVLYNPPHAKRVLPPEFYGVLKSRVPALAGIKVVGTDTDWYDRLNAAAHDLSVFVPGRQLASLIEHGASGSYSNVACLHPLGAKRWSDSMHRDLTAAKAFGQRMTAFLAEHVQPYKQQGYSNAALDKLLASVGNWADVGTRIRWPYQSIAASEGLRLRPIARQVLGDFFPDS